jgi:predicted metal-dependent hydrolase
MNVFRVPIVLIPEERRDIRGGYKDGSCYIWIPGQILRNKKLLVEMIDKIYWRILGKVALPDLERRTEELNRLHFGFEYRKVRFHRQFRRWGSCSSLKNINVSHRLIGGPEPLLEYVLLHELGHLRHQNHRKEFWSLVKSTGVNPATVKQEIIMYGRKWMKDYQDWYRGLGKLKQGN